MARSVQLLGVCTKSARYFPECIRSDVVDRCEYHYCKKVNKSVSKRQKAMETTRRESFPALACPGHQASDRFRSKSTGVSSAACSLKA